MEKYIKNYDELVCDLNIQIKFIENSVNAYLNGNIYEAKRIATVLRTLLHDTRNSTSLLTHLELKDKLYFLDNATPYCSTNLLNSNLLLDIIVNNNGVLYMPRLSTSNEHIFWISFNDWWGRPVITFGNNKKTFSRRDVVLFLADTDGGAHVDNKLDENYYNLTRKNGQNTFAQVDGVESPIGNDCFDKTVVSIAFEVLETFHAQLKEEFIHIDAIETVVKNK